MVAAILLAVKMFGDKPADFYVLAGFSGLLDVDPITLSMARLAGTGVTQAVAVAAILIAAAANAAAKFVLGAAFGGARLGAWLGACALLAGAAGALAYWHIF